jgi:hypothetical protein
MKKAGIIPMILEQPYKMKVLGIPRGIQEDPYFASPNNSLIRLPHH